MAGSATLAIAVVAMWLAAPTGVVARAAADRTIWEGVYTSAQAARGEEAFRVCTYCHGRDLRGADDPPGPPLKGAIFLSRWNDKTLGDLLIRIAETMPRNNPGSLSPETYADIVGYMLQANDVPAGALELPADIEQLDAIGIRARPLESAR